MEGKNPVSSIIHRPESFKNVNLTKERWRKKKEKKSMYSQQKQFQISTYWWTNGSKHTVATSTGVCVLWQNDAGWEWGNQLPWRCESRRGKRRRMEQTLMLRECHLQALMMIRVCCRDKQRESVKILWELETPEKQVAQPPPPTAPLYTP